MFDTLPLWLQVVALVAVGIGVLALWGLTLGGLLRQDQDRQRRHAPPVLRDANGRRVRGPHDLRNTVLMVLGSLALVAGVVALFIVFEIPGHNVARIAVFLAIVAVAVQRWQAHGQAKRAEAERRYPPYQPYRGQ